MTSWRSVLLFCSGSKNPLTSTVDICQRRHRTPLWTPWSNLRHEGWSSLIMNWNWRWRYHALLSGHVAALIRSHMNGSIPFKAGVNMNRCEIWSDIKKEIVRIKMGWKHYQTVDPRKREPQVARVLFGIRLLILHFKFQFSKSIKSSTFHIFLVNLTYPLRKNIPFPKCPKITQKFTQNRQTVVNEISREI